MLERPESQSDWSFMRPPGLTDDVVVLARRTSLAEAVSMARTGVFWPLSCDPMYTDSGLNAFIADQPGRLDQIFRSSEIWLVLYWKGPREVTSTFPLARNVLCIDLPWRVVVPVGSDEHLSIAGLSASEEVWSDYHVKYPWFCLGTRLKNRYRRTVITADRAVLERAIEEGHSIRVGVTL